MKISLKPTPRPRNPLVAPMRGRHGGSHRPATARQRQDAARALRDELARLRHP